MVEPTNLKNMSQNGFIFPNFRGDNKKYLSCHHLEKHIAPQLHQRAAPTHLPPRKLWWNPITFGRPAALWKRWTYPTGGPYERSCRECHPTYMKTIQISQMLGKYAIHGLYGYGKRTISSSTKAITHLVVGEMTGLMDLFPSSVVYRCP